MKISEFNQDLFLIIKKIQNREIFSLVRYGDGEYNILKGNDINFLHKAKGEFKYQNNDINDRLYREKLIRSIKFRQSNYYVGIISPCCYHPIVEAFLWMKKFSGQTEKNLTWASIFTNANYRLTLEKLLPEFNKFVVNIIINRDGDASKLPFSVNKIFYVGQNAWVKDYSTITKIKNYIEENNISGELFLFCAGPLSNILIHELIQFSNDNIYLDFGAILDIYLFDNRPTRQYQFEKQIQNHHCKWM